ncbi:MAG: porphobilinogen synthase [Bryobacteraceae bacterium]|nr:porphobilinogen synthase [Bryobacteraceae bacterium]
MRRERPPWNGGQTMAFPVHRLRRLRRTENIRRLVRETSLAPDDFIYPIFVTGANDVRRPLKALPGLDLLSGKPLAEEARELKSLGVPATLIFPVLEEGDKDAKAALAYSADGPAQRAMRTLRDAAPGLILIADLCLCEYTLDGHCGLIRDGEIDNDLTLEYIQKSAVSFAQAGADIIAPSAMMDGMVQAIRSGLDAAGYSSVLTMSYSAKFCSGLYGPFKAATNSAPSESKHATHQVDVGNARQAMTEIRLDIEEGADMVIVKPALGYLDIVARALQEFEIPIAAYNVSGEYNMVLQAAGGDADYRARLMFETLTCIKRAGADMIITYFAKDASRALA